MDKFEEYKDLLDDALHYYYSIEDNMKYFKRLPKSRYYSFKHALNYLNNLRGDVNVVELGTICSFVDGRFEGCNSSDTKYWQPLNTHVWDWSAGMFTRVISECTNKNVNLTTVDNAPIHLARCKLITKEFSEKISYVISTSEEYLSSCRPRSIDLLYLDTGDVTPVEQSADLQLREAKLIVEKDLLKYGGLIIIDDVKNIGSKKASTDNNFGKAMYSLPYLLQNGYSLVMDEYQVILTKK